MEFNNLPIRDGTKDAVAAMGYEEATPIQEQCIPLMLNGDDVIGRAQTGTGKTAAFGIPLVEGITGEGVRGLVLVPTRELAIQVSKVLKEIARGSAVQVSAVYGGAGFDGQINFLRKEGTKILVACPGRLLDLMSRGDADIRSVQMLVLDEADRMLDMGFINDMRKILAIVPKSRQTGLFSATLDARIKKLASDFMRDPKTIEVESETVATELTTQYKLKAEKKDKPQLLYGLLSQEVPEKAVIFMRTKHAAKRMADNLNKRGWASVALQGNMTQNQRERAMEAFRGKARVLVATDVAARGLDVEGITHVFNFDLPMEIESYVHRIGRTGRNGRTGVAYSFVQGDEKSKMRDIERLAGMEVPFLKFDGDADDGPDDAFFLPRPMAHAPRPKQPRGKIQSSTPRSARQTFKQYDERPEGERPQGRGPSRGGRPQGNSGGRPHGNAGGRPQGRGPSRGGRPQEGRSGGRPQGNSGGRPQGNSGGRPQGNSGGDHPSYARNDSDGEGRRPGTGQNRGRNGNRQGGRGGRGPSQGKRY